MKQLNTLLLFVFLIMSGKGIAQHTVTPAPQLTPGGFFDIVYDQYGNQYNLADLSLTSSNPPPMGKTIGGGGQVINSLPTASCSAGYFNVYYAAGSYWDNSVASQTALCQVLFDVSNHISSSLTATGNKINIYCNDLDATSISNSVAANGSAMYIIYNYPMNPNQGIVYSTVQQMIISGQDPYTSVLSTGSLFYHAYININPNFLWHLDNTSTNVSPTDIDFYTVFLHEVTHVLGFVSAINSDGYSKFGAGSNYYSVYDQFLYNSTTSLSLLTSSNSLTPPYNVTDLIFSGSTLAIQNGTSCPAKATYSSSNVNNVAVFSPTVYSLGSSLHHFDDVCSTPISYTPAPSCSLTPNYFVMNAAAADGGSCYVKRYLKEEEHYVLCDLGYSVSSTYTSTAAGANYTYSGGSCGITNVWGVNDGVQNGIYTYTAAAGVNTISIPITGTAGILYNDATTATTIGGVQVMYNNATCTNTGTELLVTASPGVTGLSLLKYYPSNGTVIGNATYVYVYFASGNCTPSNLCNMVQNGDFESSPVCNWCGEISYNGACSSATQVAVNCWENIISSSADIYASGCTLPPPGFSGNFTANDMDINANPSLGTRVLGFGALAGVEGARGMLSAPLTPSQEYQLSLSAYNVSNMLMGGINPGQQPFLITIGSQPVNAVNTGFPPSPSNWNVLTQFTVNPVNIWVTLTNTFVFPSTITVPHGAIIIKAEALPGGTVSIYALVDNISMQPLPTTTFIIPNAIVCGSPTFTDLAQYASPVPGYFSGQGVTQNTTSGQYDFNINGNLPTGTYPIAFTYTSGTCVNTLYQNITLNNPTATITASSSDICAGNSVTLTAAGNFTSVTWQPAGSSLNPVVVSPTATTIYSVTATTSCAATTSTLAVNVYSSSPTLSLAASGSSICQGGSATLSATGTFTSLVWQPGGFTSSVMVVSPTVTTVYTVTTGSLCSSGSNSIATETFAVNIYPAPTLSLLSSNNGTLCPETTLTLTAAGSQTATLWQPGGFTTSAIVLNPTISTVYTVTATGPCGNITSTIDVNVLGGAIEYFNLSSTLNGTYTSLSAWNAFIAHNDMTVSGAATFSFAHVIIDPNVKITVPSGSTLNINGSHLHTCEEQMWQGIEVEDGGVVTTNLSASTGSYNTRSSLIEDAAIAIFYNRSVSTSSTGIPPALVQVQNTIFNKNYTDIAINHWHNYTLTPAFYGTMLKVNNCVFTCRQLTNYVLSQSWANTGNGNSTQLHYSASASGLSAPYLQNYTTATLKAPYANSAPRCIFINQVGYTDAGGNHYGVTIGDASSPNNFNLFDNLAVFINAQNSHVKLQNNVFQNQTHALVPPGLNGIYTVIGSPPVPGWSNNAAAVMHRNFALSHITAALDMSAANTAVGNRFYNCVRGVQGYHIADFKLSHAAMRSAHTTTDVSNPNCIGAEGLILNSSNVNYNIYNNEFTNIKDVINVPFNAVQTGALTSTLWGGGFAVISPAYTSTFALIAIHHNTFSVPANGFMNQAVNITNALNLVPNMPVTMPSPITLNSIYSSTSFQPQGCVVANNHISDAWRGINISDFTGVPIWVAQNNIALKEDNINGGTQRAIALSGITGGSFSPQYVWENTLQGDASAISNTLISLVYGSLNAGISSPSISCNSTSNAGVGFRFNGLNVATPTLAGTQWNGNSMQNMTYGMLLDNNGIIGQQGNSSVGMGNQWLGTWTPNVNYGIFTHTSIASASPLYTKPALMPPNLDGDPQFFSYLFSPPFSSTLDKDCVSGTAIVVNPYEWDESYLSSLQLYLLKAQLYHFLRYNENVRAGNDDMNTWYNDMAGSSFEQLETVQEKLYTGEYDEARSMLNDLVAENYIEEKDVQYYNLYANYLQSTDEERFTEADSLALTNIAHLCPADYGTVVFKARGLLNSLYGVAVLYDDCNTGGEEARFAQTENQSIKQSEDWNIELFPNPAQDKVTLVNSNERDNLQIRICDLTGRVVLSKQLKTESYFSSMDLDLINGVYITTITNEKNQTIIKKLFIAK